jgi:hypothetical protein
MDLSDLMQQIGRTARAAGRTGDAIIFLPYWLFSYEEDKPEQTPLPTDKGKTRGKKIPVTNLFLAKRRVLDRPNWSGKTVRHRWP